MDLTPRHAASSTLHCGFPVGCRHLKSDKSGIVSGQSVPTPQNSVRTILFPLGQMGVTVPFASLGANQLGGSSFGEHEALAASIQDRLVCVDGTGWIMQALGNGGRLLALQKYSAGKRNGDLRHSVATFFVDRVCFFRVRYPTRSYQEPANREPEEGWVNRNVAVFLSCKHQRQPGICRLLKFCAMEDMLSWYVVMGICFTLCFTLHVP